MANNIRVEYKETRSCNTDRTSKNYVIAKRREYNNDTWANDNIPFQRIVDCSWMAGWYMPVRGCIGVEGGKEGTGGRRDEHRAWLRGE